MISKIFTAKPAWANGIAIIRACTGVMIIMFGKEIYNEDLMANYVDFTTHVGFPAPRFMAYLAKVTEIAGGGLLILGLFTRIITLPLLFIMAVIIWFMADGNFFNSGTAGTFFLLFLLFFFTGPGKWSLDYVFFERKKQAGVNVYKQT